MGAQIPDVGQKQFYSASKSRQKKYDGFYYIHYHVNNIGALYGQNLDDATRLFSNHRDEAYKKMKTEVVKSWRTKINKIDSSMLTLLNNVFQQQDDTELSLLNQEMQQFVEDKLSKSAVETTNHNFLELQQQARSVNVSTILNNWKTKKAVQELDKTIQSIADAVKLLNSPLSSGLAVALLEAQQTNKSNSVKSYSQHLQKALNNFKKNNAIVLSEDIDSAIKALKNLCKNIETGKNKKGEPLTKEGLRKTIDYVFSNGMSEYIIANALNNTKDKVDKSIATVIGSEPGALVYDKTKDIKGDRTGKTDVRLSNVALTCKTGILANQEMQMEIDLSLKEYITSGFQHNNKILPNKISSGGGGSLKQAFRAAFGTNTIANYYAYNTMAHRVVLNNNATSQAFNDILTARLLRRIFMQRNQKELSMFLVVNGEVISFWEILQHISEIGSGSFSSSVKGSNQIVTLRLPDTKDISGLNQRLAETNITGGNEWVAIPWARSKRVVQTINRAKVEADLHLDKYYQMIGARKNQ